MKKAQIQYISSLFSQGFTSLFISATFRRWTLKQLDVFFLCSFFLLIFSAFFDIVAALVNYFHPWTRCLQMTLRAVVGSREQVKEKEIRKGNEG